MDKLKVLDKSFSLFLSEKQIQEKIASLAQHLNEKYQGKRPLFLVILNGAFMFASDLFGRLDIEAEITFIKLASYKGLESTGEIITSIGLDKDLSGRPVIIIEDIVDTGRTLYHYLPQIKSMRPASVELVVLLHKPNAMTFPVHIDHCCFEIENKFVVGYGLDYDGFGRNTRDIYQLEE